MSDLGWGHATPSQSPWEPPTPRSVPRRLQPRGPTEYLLQRFRSAVQSTSAMVTSARPGNSFLERSSQVGARSLQCPHLGTEHDGAAEALDPRTHSPLPRWPPGPEFINVSLPPPPPPSLNPNVQVTGQRQHGLRTILSWETFSVVNCGLPCL